MEQMTFGNWVISKANETFAHQTKALQAEAESGELGYDSEEEYYHELQLQDEIRFAEVWS